jgi:FkbM family methyltransferase
MASYIYGAGNMGREVLAHWRSAGTPPTAFVDRAAHRVPAIDGVPVIAPDAVPDAADARVLVALHSPGADVASVVRTLAAKGFATIDTLWAACRRDGWLPALPYWLAPDRDWNDDDEAIAAARALLVDDRSRRVFDAQLRLRVEGRYDVEAPTAADQYFPEDLPRWQAPLVLVDCGAFDGDTVRAAQAAGYAVDGYVAFEPDPDNFAALSRNVGAMPGTRLLRAGAAAARGTLRFAAGAGPSAHLDAAGTIEVPVVAIDEVCGDVWPTLIKMDIEGGERDALEGARATLARCRPGLAISVYHRPDDLWRIPLWIAALDLGYRFDLRSHAHCGFDTVLYARAA